MTSPPPDVVLTRWERPPFVVGFCFLGIALAAITRFLAGTYIELLNGWPGVAAGGLLFLLGLCFLIRHRIRIGASSVRYSRRSLLMGSSSWKEPREDFKGILRHTRVVVKKDRRGRPYRELFFTLTLTHQKKERCLELYSGSTAWGLRRMWEGLSKETGFPAVLKDADGKIHSRPADALDKSVRELLAEGIVERTGASDKELLMKKIRLSEMDGRLHAEQGSGKMDAFVYGAAGIMILALILDFAVGARIDPWLAGVFGGSAVLIAIVSRIRETLTVSRAGARWKLSIGRATLLRKDLPAGGIEEVVRVKDPWRRSTAVLIASDDGAIYFGHQGSADEQAWLEDRILKLLSD